MNPQPVAANRVRPPCVPDASDGVAPAARRRGDRAMQPDGAGSVREPRRAHRGHDQVVQRRGQAGQPLAAVGEFSLRRLVAGSSQSGQTTLRAGRIR